MAARKWKKVPEFDFKDIIYEKKAGVARVTINRPDAYNAFTTSTQDELIKAFENAAIKRFVPVVMPRKQKLATGREC
jgi:1,4-dihydroxy-2-naphthoyl-CoA synthase